MKRYTPLGAATMECFNNDGDYIKYSDYQVLEQKAKRLEQLLFIAKCPNCDETGIIAEKIIKSGSRQISETAFEQTPKIDFDYAPCQWCDEVNKLREEIEEAKSNTG